MNSHDINGQLTLRGVIVGIVGCIIITASSVYVALKMGALPWPIVFAAVVSLFALRVISRGRASLNEVNVTHTVMSAGAMVAGGLAFTIPGAWMTGLAEDVSTVQLLVIAICGSMLGLVGSVVLRRHFIESAKLEFPIGEAAAQTLKAGNVGGKVGIALFFSMALSGIFAILRDGLALFPKLFGQGLISGTTFGIYNSPMMAAIGFLVGKRMVAIWFIGALIANFGIICGGQVLGLVEPPFASQIVSSLGMGTMMGCGVAVIVRDVLPKALSSAKKKPQKIGSRAKVCALVFLTVSVGLVTLFLDFPLWISVLVVALGFVACAMSAQSVGQTGIDPMEIFGLIVLLLVALVSPINEVKLFFIAALVAVACGLAGDVMNDFKAGATLGTNPKAQWLGQAIGAIIGCFVAVFVMQLLFKAHGAQAFGLDREFVAAQASVVATLVEGIPVPEAFWVGIILGFALYIFRFPSMMLGLGIYLPFYMSFTAFIGAAIRFAFDAILASRTKALKSEAALKHRETAEETALIAASGILGGESIIGIIIAIISASAMLGL